MAFSRTLAARYWKFAPVKRVPAAQEFWLFAPSTVVDAAAVLEALELLVALVELVVAHGGDVEAERVERLDGRLVVEGGRQQRRGADHVAGGDGDGVGVADAGLLEVRREVLDAADVGRVVRLVGPVWMRPLEPDGGSRFPWKSLNDRIWIGNWVLPGALLVSGPAVGAARAGAARAAAQIPATATPVMRRVVRDMCLPLFSGVGRVPVGTHGG